MATLQDVQRVIIAVITDLMTRVRDLTAEIVVLKAEIQALKDAQANTLISSGTGTLTPS